MPSPFDKPRLRVPVKFVQGHWEYFYGGPVPVLEGCVADLVVEHHAITDPTFLRSLQRKAAHRVLRENTELRVALTIRSDLPEALHRLLMKVNSEDMGTAYYESVRPAETRLVSITVGKPSLVAARRLKSDEGGVWLHLEGARPKSVSVSSVQLPQGVVPHSVESLNHAFTCLSTAFEPWRKSHTGNVYTRVLYREENGKWYPLETLRRAAEATEEQTLVRERWAEIAQTLLPGMESDSL
ncbi:MAG: hypothetical protein ABIP11_09970 [Luteimonas sp.]